MEQEYYRIAGKCPHYESVRSARGIESGMLDTRDLTPRCDHCAYWAGGSCDLFLARGKS